MKYIYKRKILDLLKVKGMTSVLRKLSVNGWKTLEKKFSLCFVTGKMQGKK